ncbi:MAG TPA: hypothetical protein VGN34_04285 [Ktedonobacteraceae bacterium]
MRWTTTAAFCGRQERWTSSLPCSWQRVLAPEGARRPKEEQDWVLPAAVARLLAHALPHGTATFSPHEGHLSTFVNPYSGHLESAERK